MSRYARGYIKQDLHDNLIYDNATTAAAATAAVNAKLDDCTVSDVTASRANNTVYQNTSGKIMTVHACVSESVNAGSGGVNIAYIGATSSPATVINKNTYLNAVGIAYTMYDTYVFTVPPSYYYKVNGLATIVSWVEITEH